MNKNNGEIRGLTMITEADIQNKVTSILRDYEILTITDNWFTLDKSQKPDIAQMVLDNLALINDEFRERVNDIECDARNAAYDLHKDRETHCEPRFRAMQSTIKDYKEAWLSFYAVSSISQIRWEIETNTKEGEYDV